MQAGACALHAVLTARYSKATGDSKICTRYHLCASLHVLQILQSAIGQSRSVQVSQHKTLVETRLAGNQQDSGCHTTILAVMTPGSNKLR